LRSEFDTVLLRNAAQRGAEINEGHTVIEATHSYRHGAVVTARDRNGEMVRCRARFLLDASGRDAFVASRRKLRDMTPHLRKAAVFSHYENVPRDEGRAAGDIVLVVLRDGWFWFIPLPEGRMSVGVVAEGSRLKQSGLPPAELLDQAIRRCPAAWKRMREARRVAEVWSASDYSYGCREVAGDGYLLLGDAAAFIDPVFSTGVWLAMSSAEMAADTLHRALGGPAGGPGNNGRQGDLSPATFARYEKKVVHHVATYTRMVSHFYSPGFMDVFLQPSRRYGLKESVVSLLAGLAEPPMAMNLRLWLFYTIVKLQRRIGVVQPVPLLGVLEESNA
ncbi:MAG TPA: tryptophan 7-halogenase, partial [Ktedonobacterales bacterium]|nr:tryptophan 7-halogenase [Ktedonobacterales bacterium]